jgi:hypothetical protein
MGWYTSVAPAGAAPRGGTKCWGISGGRGGAGGALAASGRARAAGAAPGVHQRLDLRARERAAQIGERPAALEDHRVVLVHVVQQEDAARQPGERALQPGAIEALAAGRRALEAVEQARLVPLGLQPADEPGAGVGQALVVEVHRVLGGQHHPHAEGARLLEQGEQRRLRRRVGHRGEVAEDLVHVDERAQARGAGLRAHPADHLVEQQRHEEHPLRVVEVRDRDDRHPRLAGGRVQQGIHLERLALHPGAEAGGGQQVVERHGEREAVLGGKERLEVEHTDPLHRRVLDLLDEGGQIERLALAPGPVQDRGDQDVLAALDGVGVDAEQAEQAGGGGADPLAQQLVVVADGGRGRGERFQDGQRDARAAAGGEDRELGRVAEPLDPGAVLTPGREALLPELRLLAGVVVGGDVLAARVVLVDPGPEVLGPEAREGEQQVGQIALGIDEQRRHAVQRRLLDQGQAEAGLAAAGHPDAHRVGDQILRVVEEEILGGLLRLPVVEPPQVEDAQLLEGRGARHDGSTAGASRRRRP